MGAHPGAETGFSGRKVSAISRPGLGRRVRQRLQIHGGAVKFGSCHIKVVAVMKPEEYVIRAISSWHASVEQMITALLLRVGTQDPTLVWTGYTYEGPPWYTTTRTMMGDDAIRLPHGIYRLPITNVVKRTYPSKYGPDEGDVILGPAEKLADYVEDRLFGRH